MKQHNSSEQENKALEFKRSSLCASGECVEVAFDKNETVVVRDNKNVRAGNLRFKPAEWEAFVAGVKNGEFDLPE